MAVSAVKVVSIIGLLRYLEPVIQVCGKSEIFHPDDALSFYSDTHNFTPLFEENPYSPALGTLKNLLQSVEKKPVLVPNTNELSFSDEELFCYVERINKTLEPLISRKSELHGQIEQCKKLSAEISHFVGLNLDLEKIFSCQFIKVRFGRLPKESYQKLQSYTQNPYVAFFESTSDATHYWGVYFAPIEQSAEVDRIFSSLFFERLRISATDGTPEERVKSLAKDIEAAQDEITRIEKSIDAFWQKEEIDCDKIYSKLLELDTYFGIKRYVFKYHSNFILTGWIPAENEEEFKAQLNQLSGINYTIERAEEASHHAPPVKLKNKRLFRPFEYFVDMYGLPKYDEVDPTPFVAITYILLFGVMFADLGQGLCIVLVGYLMWRLKAMPLGKILMRCGVSSALFGLVFGSVFGYEHVLDPMYHALFGLEGKPIEVMEPVTTNYIIYSAVAIGVALVIVAMLINIYSSCKRKRWEEGIFGPNGLAGLLFYASLIFGLVAQIVLGLSVMTWPYIVCLIVLPLFSIFLREPLGKLMAHDPNWKPEKWGEYIMQNIFELIELLLSYATNTISFMRVGAFVLVHSGMMTVVFTLAEMSSGIGYAIIVVIGNAFVMAMEALLVAIQVLRLEFYELFSRFFEGGGRPFKAVTVKSRAS